MRGIRMFITVMIGRHVSIQGRFLRRLASGLVLVRVGERQYAGRPVGRL